jgi:hypothetical protein
MPEIDVGKFSAYERNGTKAGDRFVRGMIFTKPPCSGRGTRTGVRIWQIVSVDLRPANGATDIKTQQILGRGMRGQRTGERD